MLRSCFWSREKTIAQFVVYSCWKFQLRLDLREVLLPFLYVLRYQSLALYVNLSQRPPRSGEAWVHYATERQQRLIPAWKVLAGEVTAAEVEGRLVLVGSSAQGLMDLRFSPLGGVIPGVEAHAQILEQALTDSFLYRPNWATAVEALTLVVAGLGIG